MLQSEILELEAFCNNELKGIAIFPYVAQRENWDCGVACVAMVLRQQYINIRKMFPERPQKGISGYNIAKLVNSPNLVRHYKLKPIEYYCDNNNYILLTKKDKSDWGHYVVKDSYNYIYDPEVSIMPLKDYEREFVSFHIKL